MARKAASLVSNKTSFTSRFHVNPRSRRREPMADQATEHLELTSLRDAAVRKKVRCPGSKAWRHAARRLHARTGD
jgi:hypothetical protein